MLGVDDFLMILVATTAANLLVEVGAEVVAEWLVNSPDSPLRPPDLDPTAATEQIRYVPDTVNHFSAQADHTMPWSERLAHTLGVKVSDQLAAKIDYAAAQTSALSGQIAARLGAKAQELSAKADALSAKIGATAVWSEQLISSLGTSLGLQ